MADLAEEYSARAAVFRKLAAELKTDEGRATLLAIAEDYEVQAVRRRGRGSGAR